MKLAECPVRAVRDGHDVDVALLDRLHQETDRAWKAKNKERRAAYSRAWKAKNKERSAASSRYRWRGDLLTPA